MPESCGKQELGDGDRRRPCAGNDDLYMFFFLSYHLQGIGQPRQRNNGGAVLVIVENGDIAPLF